MRFSEISSVQFIGLFFYTSLNFKAYCGGGHKITIIIIIINNAIDRIKKNLTEGNLARMEEMRNAQSV